MTAKQQILQKPTLVQRVIRAKMTKDSIDDPNPDWDAYAKRALDWWNEKYREASEASENASETMFAEAVIKRVKGWGDLLRR